MKNLRVSVEEEKHELYKQLQKRGSENPEDYPFQTMKDVFMLAACLGSKYNTAAPLKTAVVIFDSAVFDSRTDVPVMSALAYKQEPRLSILNDEKAILKIVQELANGGLDYVEQHIIQTPGRPLNNLVNLILNDQQ